MNEILRFRSPSEFRKWLAANHHQSEGIWLRIFKRDAGEPSVSYAEAKQKRMEMILAMLARGEAFH